MIHMLVYLPVRAGMTDAERYGTDGNVYVPTCKVPGATSNTPAPPEFVATCLGHTDELETVDCPACVPEAAKFLADMPRERFSYGTLPSERV